MKTKNSLKLILSTFAIVLSLAFTLCAGASIFKSDTLPNSQEFEASAFGISAVGSKQLTVVARGAKDGEDQVFRYRVTGKSATDFIDFEVLIVGNGSVTIKNMPTGHYVVTEILELLTDMRRKKEKPEIVLGSVIDTVSGKSFYPGRTGRIYSGPEGTFGQF